MNLACAATSGAISSVVERFIDIEEVGGSIPPSRTDCRKQNTAANLAAVFCDMESIITIH